jgi:hypothetical protein
MLARSLTLLFTMLVVSAGLWAKNDPLIGTWKLNLAQSKYSPGRPMRSETLTFAPFGDGGGKVTVDQVDAQGKQIHPEYSANFDAKDYPVTGAPDGDAVLLKRIDANTTERIYKKTGKVTKVVRRVVSKDGKMLTNTATGTNAQGQQVHNVTVFDKQ